MRIVSNNLFKGRALPLKVKLLIAATIAAGLLVIVPSAHSQVAPAPPTFSKTAFPNPATVGQPLTFFISETNNTAVPITVIFTDVYPSSLVFVGFIPFGPTGGASCFIFPASNFLGGGVINLPPGTTASCGYTFIPTQPGLLTNTATDSFGQTASVTVCVQTPGGNECTPPAQQHNPQQRPVCPPASQELGNESQSGDVNLSGEITSSGDSSNQTAAPLEFGNSGSLQNAQGVLQTCGSQSGDAELEGGSMNFSPTLDSASNQGVGQSSGSSGQ